MDTYSCLQGGFLCAEAVRKYLFLSDQSGILTENSSMPWFAADHACSPPSQASELRQNTK